MAIKNNDDVAHLLQATGASGSYKEFEGQTDQMSAPLIDAVFGKDAPTLAAAEQIQPLDIARESDLLAEVFDRPPPSAWQNDQAGLQAAQRPAAAPSPAGRLFGGVPTAMRRSLADIRKIIVQPTEEAARPPSADGLNGLFDRLAG